MYSGGAVQQQRLQEIVMSVTNLQVQEVSIAGVVGYQVQGYQRACSDSLWERLAHNAVFRDRTRAERFLRAVCRKPSWEWTWTNWGAPHDAVISDCDAFQGRVTVYTVL
jgi:hypothetical protein